MPLLQKEKPLLYTIKITHLNELAGFLGRIYRTRLAFNLQN
uniref:Uncharacterized protein n=1 Tax=Bartonella schoenbuchensis (strain DSM 13525 / NCTC 13165 / R1) TaxID=687861 RepID=E6Z0N5_BARSR|nr:hypothetical protein B11C_90018 [Bartonella schoenbuchensis R1]